MISPSAAPSRANSSTSPSAFLNTTPFNPLLLSFPKPFDFQDRVYRFLPPPTIRVHSRLFAVSSLVSIRG
jgi:hypothetical protein